MYVYTYIHTNIHTYIHTYTHTHTHIHTCMHAYMHACIHTGEDIAVKNLVSKNPTPYTYKKRKPYLHPKP